VLKNDLRIGRKRMLCLKKNKMRLKNLRKRGPLTNKIASLPSRENKSRMRKKKRFPLSGKGPCPTLGGPIFREENSFLSLKKIQQKKNETLSPLTR